MANFNLISTKNLRNFGRVILGEKNSTLLVWILTSAIVGGLAGGIVGYRVAGTATSGNPTNSIFNRIINPTTTVVSDEDAKVIAMVKRVAPSVVSIVASKDLVIVEGGGYNPFQNFCNDPFFRQFLGSQCDVQPSAPSQRTQRQQVAAGTGFIISADGYVLTNKHVIDIAGADFTVITNDGKKYPAKIVAKDPLQDLAVVKINASALPALTLGDSSKLQVGQTVIAIGNALGQFSNSVSKGVVSGLSRSISASEGGANSEKLEQVIQTDAAINPGNSGGPLLDLNGEVIGINTAIVQGAQNIGFALPINQAKKDVSQVTRTGKISYPFLGIQYTLVNSQVKADKNFSVDYGALIVRGQNDAEPAVTPGSPADQAGIREGDIILTIGGKKISADYDLAKALQSYNVGNTVRLEVLSQGQRRIVEIKLAERAP